MDNVFDFFELRAEEQTLKDLKIFAIDIETTGIDVLANEIIEIGIARLDVATGKIEPVFTSFVKPIQPLPATITDITGICEDDLIGAPLIAELLDQVGTILHGSLTVAHNAEFDFSFLRKFFGPDFTTAHDIAVLDTLKLSRQWIRAPRYSLAKLVEHLGLAPERHHRATDDAIMCLRVLQHLISIKPELLDARPMDVIKMLG
jgi:DNA polymerase-3 subunit alpha (Gram-positive type)